MNIYSVAKVMIVSLLLIFLVSSSAISFDVNDDEYETQELNTSSHRTSYNENYYTWQDEFDNAQGIDESYSEHFIVKDSIVEMYGTYPQWTNPEWTRMKIISIQNAQAIDDCIIKLTIEYDSDMKADYSDLRFKFNDDDYWLSYWIEEINPEPNDPYALVWVRISSLPAGESVIHLFYGNPSASDMSDYWSVFDENSWQNYYIHDHQVTYHMESEGAWDPDVSWGDNKFFVTWEEGIPLYLPLGMLFKQQIRGCFYSEDGEQLGERFDLTPWLSGSTTQFRCENPSSVYGQVGSEQIFFVSYEYYNNPNDAVSRDIKGILVPTDASSISDVTSFDICTSSGNQADPIVSFDKDNQRFFVVWEDGREGTENYNIYGRLFDIDGHPIGTEKVISSRPNSQCEPWMTFDDVNNHYMIVWEEGVDPELGPFEIWGQLFSVNGDPLGDAQRLSPEGVSGTDYNFPSVAFCDLTERFLITWQEDDLSSNDWYGNIWGKMLDENGNTVVDTFKIANGAYERTDIVPYLSSSFFVVFDGGGDIWGKLVSSDGDVNSYVLQLSDSESDPADWANIASNGEKIFVAWEDERIVYIDPYESLDLPDVFANVWSFNTPSGSDVSYSVGEEKSLILESCITSKPIQPENLDSWHQFSAVKQGDVSFDIVDGADPSIVLMSDVSPGASIASIQSSSIRLKAWFVRQNPSSSPLLDSWSVQYVGVDEQPPVTRVQDIEGVTGLNDWYISESVILWLSAEDYPEDTGSGIDAIYYTLNNGETKEYNAQSGLQLSATQDSDWMGDWTVTFWSVDNAGNSENRHKEENSRRIKIDADRPYIEITEPSNEGQVAAPFWVRTDPSDNAGIERVEFDIEPFGERPGLPYVDTEPPYEWYCDVEQIKDIIGDGSFGMVGVNVMLRAQVYDESGQTWIHEIWAYITNWKRGDEIQVDNGFLFGYDMIQGSQACMDTSFDSVPLAFNWYQGDLQWDTINGFCIVIDPGSTVKTAVGAQTGVASTFSGMTFAQGTMFIGYAEQITIQT